MLMFHRKKTGVTGLFRDKNPKQLVSNKGLLFYIFASCRIVLSLPFLCIKVITVGIRKYILLLSALPECYHDLEFGRVVMLLITKAECYNNDKSSYHTKVK